MRGDFTDKIKDKWIKIVMAITAAVGAAAAVAQCGLTTDDACTVGDNVSAGRDIVVCAQKNLDSYPSVNLSAAAADWSVIADEQAVIDEWQARGGLLEFEGPPGALYELVQYEALEHSFKMSVRDSGESVSLWWPEWAVTAPYYARVAVKQLTGPEEWRACGLVFNLKADKDEDNGLHYLMASGRDAKVSQWLPRHAADNAVDHSHVGGANEVIGDFDEPAVLELLVDAGGEFTAAIDGHKFANFTLENLEPGRLIGPAIQQETQHQRGTVSCEFTDFEVRQG